MSEHLELQPLDIIRFQNGDGNELLSFGPDDGLGCGDLLYRRVVYRRSDGWYLTVGFYPDDGKTANWDCCYLSQAYIDRFAKKLMRSDDDQTNQGRRHDLPAEV